MKKNLFFAAVAIVALASCADNEYVGDNSPNQNPERNSSDAIVFSSGASAFTRADIGGKAAADLLGSNFYVEGTKGSEPDESPTTSVVFDNYLVHYTVNTSGTTESNTANWEYVGVTPEAAPTANYKKLGTYGSQTIKYWDFSTEQYDFLAFSTGTYKAGTAGDEDTKTIGVTKIATGTTLATAAYTFDVPSVTALENTFITDITEVLKENYGKEVTLKFKNLGAKVRIALYETVPGYAVRDVNFYQWDGTTDFATGEGKVKGTTAALISANTNGFPHSASIAVNFPHIGVNNSPEAQNPNTPKTDYNKASATVTPVTASSQKWQTFGTLDNFADTKEASTLANGSYIGRTLPTATFAGESAANYYQTVFPVSDPSPITLRVDYTLVSIDGSGEEINVYGAKAVVPSTYTKWLPNYAYTYIFKISDNTNGWTSPTASTDGTDPGIFPITFDAVVAEATDANAEQTTITTVATPTITTYQQGHKYTTNEYSKSTKGKDNVVRDVYVQVMDNSASSATLKADLNGTTPHDGTNRSLLYAITGTAPISEATVMDALENQASVADGVITGRNGMILTPNENIDATVTTIVNGVDDEPISLGSTPGKAAKISMAGTAVPAGTYAYVYDYTTAEGGKTTTTIWQPIIASGTLDSGVRYITAASLNNIAYDSNKTAADEAVSSSYLYFSKTTNGSETTTYSYVSVDGKTTLPAGLLKVDISDNTYLKTSNGTTSITANDFAFTNYTRNDGAYAVKVIKVVD